MADFIKRILDYGTRQAFSGILHHYLHSSQVNFLVAPLLLTPWAPFSLAPLPFCCFLLA